MSITSFGFLLMICAGVSLYYILPKSWQWVELLALILIFYCMSAAPYTFVYILISTAAAYISTRFAREKGAETDRGRKLAACLGVGAVLINVGLWFVFKGKGLWMPFFGEAAVMQYLAALGMGYYTLQVIGQKNMEPAVASLILSLESVFSVLAGWIILGQALSPREMAGCALVFGAVILVQLPERAKTV